MGAIPFQREEIEYPTSDGQPLAETEIHYDAITELVAALRRRYQEVPDVWVGANMFLCYEEGNPRAVVAPDVILAKGIGKEKRDNYLLWEERPPSLIVEVTSRSTKSEDLKRKKGIYERIGVEEYILFDPRAEYLKPALQGFRLIVGKYHPIPSGPDGSILSFATGLLIRPEGDQLRLTDAATGEPLLRSNEVIADWRDAKAQAEAARNQAAAAEHRAVAAEARAVALEEELARLRREREG